MDDFAAKKHAVRQFNNTMTNYHQLIAINSLPSTTDCQVASRPSTPHSQVTSSHTSIAQHPTYSLLLLLYLCSLHSFVSQTLLPTGSRGVQAGSGPSFLISPPWQSVGLEWQYTASQLMHVAQCKDGRCPVPLVPFLPREQFIHLD